MVDEFGFRILTRCTHGNMQRTVDRNRNRTRKACVYLVHGFRETIEIVNGVGGAIGDNVECWISSLPVAGDDKDGRRTGSIDLLLKGLQEMPGRHGLVDGQVILLSLLVGVSLIEGNFDFQQQLFLHQWWAFGKVGPIGCLHSSDSTKEERNEVRGQEAGKKVDSIRLDDREKQNEIRIWPKKKQHYGYHDRSPSIKKNISKSMPSCLLWA
ncbi:hypothetical protein Ccrd_025747 [Cynara cardunculus var. scolymus]|uniref:Uncharacterized protein n=1 Tax=Cynara cardunculus var. scolymus TaxID=59895 RepID=A0A103UX74_CYNCS|nr:hypothetical protein Ccrd_025747 [Cynara cardunculus var. scolymus]